MRRSFIVGFILVLGLFVVGFDACNKVIVSVPTATVTKGETAKIPVFLSNGDDCRGMQTDVCIGGGYFTLVGSETAERTAGWKVDADNVNPPGCVRILILSMQGELLPQGHGAAGYLLYEVADDAPSGSCFEVVVTGSKVANKDTELMDVTSEIGVNICIK